MSHSFPALPYAYDALEPWIDAQTMEIHYDRHHRTYFDKFIAAAAGTPLENKSLEAIMAEISAQSPAVRNNGGGLWNHTFFWGCMAKGQEGKKPEGDLATAINSTFGSIEGFRAHFTETSLSRFGSGFAWLNFKDGKLEVMSTPNQDNPLMDVVATGAKPLLALDVWEHAYYLKYQNKRPAYVEAWWNTVNWGVVSDRFTAAKA